MLGHPRLTVLHGFLLAASVALAPLAIAVADADEAPTDSQTELSDLALFHRCYGHLTRKRLPARPNPTTQPLAAQLRQKVQSGALSGVDACVQLLQSARLDAAGNLLNDTPEGRLVLQNFQLYHSTWFPSDNFQSVLTEGEHYTNTGDIHDPTQPALFFTHALFGPNADFAEVVTGSTPMEALRDPASNSSKNNFNSTQAQNNDYLAFNWQAFEEAKARCLATPPPAEGKGPCQAALRLGNFAQKVTAAVSPGGAPMNPLFTQKGHLIGVRPMSSAKLAQTAVLFAQLPANVSDVNTLIPATTWQKFQFAYNRSQGGGILGTPSFLILNWGRDRKQMMDGGVAMPRRWSRSIFNTLLCRDLPVLRPSDTLPIVMSEAKRGAKLSFRQGATCMSCHASVDPMGAVARDLSLREANTPGDTGVNSMHMGKWFPGQNAKGANADLALASSAGSVRTLLDLTDADPDFSRRPATGLLHYRTFDGLKVAQPVTGIAGLGAALAQQDDVYVCAAKRYFAFFTGINVPLYDIGDPARATALSASDAKYRDYVIKLGRRLKEKKRLEDVLVDILSTKLYRKAGLRDIINEVTP
jgi:hypothetical protein